MPVLEEHIKLMQYLEKEGEADLLPTTIDSYTRQNRYHEAEEGIKASKEEGRAMLNQLRGRRHLLQSALLQKRPDGDDHRQLAVRRPADRPV